MTKYKMVKIQAPKTIITFQNGKTINKFYENLRGVFNLKTKEMTFDRVMSFSKVFKYIKEQEKNNNLELIISEKDYKRIFELIKSTPGWGDYDGQIELVEAFESAQEAGLNTDYENINGKDTEKEEE